MEKNYYMVYTPSSFDLTEKLGEKGFDPLQMLSYLSNINGIALNQSTFKDFLKFDLRKRGISLLEDSCNYSAYYIGNQIVKIESEAKVILVDDRRRTLTEVMEEEHDQPQAVFITCMSVNFSSAVAAAIALNHAKIPVVIGGVHISTSPDDVEIYIRKHVPFPNLISQVRGAGDSTVIQEVLKDLNSQSLKSEYSGLCYLEDGVWGNKNVADIPKKNSDFWVAPHLGCPYSCSFCSLGTLPKNQRKLSLRDPKDFINEIKEFQKESNDLYHRVITFLPDNLLMGGKNIENIIDLIIEEGIKINWASQISIDIADNEELLRKLRLSGAYYFTIGFESLDFKNLEHINKPVHRAIKRSGLTPAEYYTEKIKKIQDYGIIVRGSFIFGFPYDYFNTVDDHSGILVSKFCRKNKVIVATNALTDLPGSKDFIENQEKGNYTYEHGSMDYLLNLVKCNLLEGNASAQVPDNLKRSPLIVFYMVYYVIKGNYTLLMTLRNLFFHLRKAWKSPTHAGKASLKDRIIDTLINGSVIVNSAFLFKKWYYDAIFSSKGKKGIFEKHYDSEKNAEVKDKFKNKICKFRYK